MGKILIVGAGARHTALAAALRAQGHEIVTAEDQAHKAPSVLPLSERELPLCAWDVSIAHRGPTWYARHAGKHGKPPRY